jgi:hypothetical protein
MRSDGSGTVVSFRAPRATDKEKSYAVPTLGRTGIQVSPYCLGAMMFGAAALDVRDQRCRVERLGSWSRFFVSEASS